MANSKVGNNKTEIQSPTKTSNTPTVNCPNCGNDVLWSSASAFRPFCCERCQQLDFGEWARESYSIPTTPALNEFDAEPEAEF